MQSEDDILQQLQKDLSALLQSPPSYMRQITRISQKLVSLQIKYIFFIVNKIYQLLHDSSVPIKKKLFAFRFIKDTLLLASHSFYVLTVVRILPFMVQVLSEANRQSDNGLDFLIKKIGPKVEVSNPVQIKTFGTTLLQLINQIMKWTGTHIKLHPFYTIPFSSIFKLYLESLPKIKAIKMTDLTYFTIDSVNTYEQNFLQRELISEEQNQKEFMFIDLLINNWISLPEDDEQKKGSLKLLQNIVQTGDSNFIRHAIDCLKPLIQSQITGHQAIQVVHTLLKVKEIQFWVLVRDQLLSQIGYYVLMMSKQKFSKLENIDLMEILRQVFVWKINAVKMGMKTQTFDEFLKKMKNQWICDNESSYTSNTARIERGFEKFQYYLSQSQLQTINEEKKKHLNLKDQSTTINKIRYLTYEKRLKSNQSEVHFDEKSLPRGNQSLNKQKSNFVKNGSLNRQSDIIPEEPRVTFQTIESPSPIKQLQINNIGQSFQNINSKNSKINQDYIQFNNSLHNISSSKEIPNFQGQNKPRNNIYTRKEINEDKKSSRSIRSSRSSKKSLEKIQKASSFGFAVQRVKSSKIINSHGDQINNKNEYEHLGNQPKLKIIKFDESYQSIHHNNIRSPRNQDSMSSDNVPYKQQYSHSINHHQSNVGFSRTIVSNRKQLRHQQAIVVEETIKKPKFGFISLKNDDDSPQKLQIKKNVQTGNFITQDSLESIKVDPQLISIEKMSHYSQIPSDFNAAFGKKRKDKQNLNNQGSQSDSGINFNKFPHKVKQLQAQIQKAKQYQKLYQLKMKQKDEHYEKILKTLPLGHQKVHEENKKLQRQLEQKQRKQAQKQAIKQQRLYKSPNSKLRPNQEIPFLPSKIFSVGKIKPYESNFVRQLISAKCLLLKNDIFQLGYAFKSERQEAPMKKGPQYSICLYFKLKVKCDKLEFRLMNQSLIMKEAFEGKVMNITANKQLKFEQKVIGYTLKNEDFQIPYLQVDVKVEEETLTQINTLRQKQKEALVQQNYKVAVPCTLFNFIQFHSPSQRVQTIKTKYAIQSQFSCHELVSCHKGEHLLNSFRCGKWHQKEGEKEGGFYVALYSYVKNVKDKKLFKDKEVKVHFEELLRLERKSINFYIKKINTTMFYIESDSDFESDRLALVEISKILAR